MLKKCQGTIVLGIPQIEISSGKIKDSQIDSPFDLGTEWNHIEGALAHSLKHPLLIIHHKDVKRGVFDRGACNTFLYSVNMNDSSWSISKEISGAISNWKSELKEFDKSNALIATDTTEKPTLKWGMYKFEGESGLFCPVCYNKENLKIPTTRLNSRFYQCPNCQAKLG